MKNKQSGIFSLGIFLFLSVSPLSAGTSVSTTPAQKESAYQKLCRELDKTIDKYKLLAEKSLGRYTISPDNVAEKTLNGGPLKLITFYHNGALVTNMPLQQMKKLIEVK